MKRLDATLMSAIPLLEQFPPLPFGDATIAFLEKQYQAIDAFVDAFVAGDQSTRNAIIKPTSRCVHAFHSFAHWRAVLSVRENDPSLISRGIVALAIENLRDDYRETLIVLSLLAHSAEKLQGSAEPLFDSSLALASPEFAKFVTGFLAGPPWRRGIGAMGYREAGEGKSFIYVQNTDRPRSTPPEG
jgi:hypothetical protein